MVIQTRGIGITNNLRNNIMHGTLINEQLVIPLIVTFSGLIFISWLLNEK